MYPWPIQGLGGRLGHPGGSTVHKDLGLLLGRQAAQVLVDRVIRQAQIRLRDVALPGDVDVDQEEVFGLGHRLQFID